MSLKIRFVKMLHVVASIALIIQLTACGYFLYPERRGQKPVGRIDPGIAALDALGLLLFVVPGVIAFAVDITNGTLYFPSGRHSSVSIGTGPITMIRVNPAELNKKKIEEIINKYAGVSVTLDFGDVRICELNKSENIEVKLIELKSSNYLGD